MSKLLISSTRAAQRIELQAMQRVIVAAYSTRRLFTRTRFVHFVVERDQGRAGSSRDRARGSRAIRRASSAEAAGFFRILAKKVQESLFVGRAKYATLPSARSVPRLCASGPLRTIPIERDESQGKLSPALGLTISRAWFPPVMQEASLERSQCKEAERWNFPVAPRVISFFLREK